YPMQEGTFFGDIMDTGNLSALSKPNTTAPVAYYCEGAGFPTGAAGTVAGRQYSNGTGGSCPDGSVADPTGGCPDGYKAITTADGAVWQHGITVWRNA